jgi:hypothetical protein
MVAGLLAAIGAYTMLMVAISRARQQRFHETRTLNRHLAEAGVVIARERLWTVPAYCGGTEQVDTDGDGTGDTPVSVVVTNCGAGSNQEIRVTASN